MADAVINIAVKTTPAQPLEQLVKQSNEAEKAIGGLSSSFGKVAGAIGALAAFKGTFDFVLNATRQMEDLTTQFIAFTGSADGAKEQLERLSDFASTSPFELAEVATANRTLLAFGSTASRSIEQLRQLGEVSAATGTDLSELATIFGQIQAEGKLTGERFNQLVERGINIGPALAQSLGVAQTAIRGLISDSAISSDEVAKAFEKITSQGGQFFGATERLSKTVSGSLSTLKDNFTILASTIGTETIPVFSKVVGILNKLIEGNIAYSKAQQALANETEFQKTLRLNAESLQSLNKQLDVARKNSKDPLRPWEWKQDDIKLVDQLTLSIRNLTRERLGLIKTEGMAETLKKDAEVLKSELEKADKIDAKAREDRLAAKQAEQDELKKLADAELKKVQEKEKAITQIAFQESAVRNAILQEQEGENDAVKLLALQEREATLTSERLRIEAERQELLKQFDSAELIRQNDTIQKKLAAEKKAETERLKVIQDNKKKETDFNRIATEQQKKFDEATALEKLRMTATVLDQISVLTRNKSRELAAIGKAASLFQIGIGIPDAAQKAYTSAAIFGPVAGAAAAALAVAAGLQRLNEVRTQQLGFAEGGIVPGVGNKDSVPILATPGELIVPKSNFKDLQDSLAGGATADQIVLLQQGNEITGRILDNLVFGAVAEKLTQIVNALERANNKLDMINTGFNSSGLDIPSEPPQIREIDRRGSVGGSGSGSGGSGSNQTSSRSNDFERLRAPVRTTA